MILFNEKASDEDLNKMKNLKTEIVNAPKKIKEIVNLLDKYNIVKLTTEEVNSRIEKANSYLKEIPAQVTPNHLFYLSDKIKNRSF